MVLMYVLMFLPLMAIPVFWLLPIVQAVSVYVVSLLLSAWMFWLMHKVHRLPVASGAEALLNRDAEVLSKSHFGVGTTYVVELGGELWTADSDELIEVGETVEVVTVRGSLLSVQRKRGGQK